MNVNNVFKFVCLMEKFNKLLFEYGQYIFEVFFSVIKYIIVEVVEKIFKVLVICVNI